MPTGRNKKKRVGYTQYSSMGAFEQQRLSQYLADISSSGYNGSGFTFPSGYSSGPYSPFPPPVFGGGGGTLVEGFAPYAVQPGVDITAWSASTLSSDPLLTTANGNTLIIPIFVPAKMNVAAMSTRINGVTSPLTNSWRWDLYKEIASHILERVTGAAATTTESIPSSSTKSSVADPYPTPIQPGVYWLSLQNVTPENQLRVVAQTSVSGTTLHGTRFLRIGDADEAAETIDFTGWDSSQKMPHMILHGIGFNEDDTYGTELPAIIFT